MKRPVYFIALMFIVFQCNGQIDSVLCHAFRIAPAALGNAECVNGVVSIIDSAYVIGGHFGSSNVDLDPGPSTHYLVNNGAVDLFLARYLGSDSLVWSFNVGGISGDYLFGLDMDNDHNIYAVGEFIGNNVDFNPLGVSYNLSASSNSGYLIKYDSSGIVQWGIALQESAFSTRTNTVHVDRHNNVLISGPIQDSINLNPLGGPVYVHSNIIPGFGQYNSYLAKYNPNGNLEWGYSIGDTTIVAIKDITSDTAGNAYVIGQYTDEIDIDPTPGVHMLPACSVYSTFILKLDPAGNLVWVKSFDPLTGWNSPSTIEFGNGHIYCGGSFEQNMDADPGPGLFSLNEFSFDWRNAYVVKLDLNGDFVWAFDLDEIDHQSDRTDFEWNPNDSNVIVAVHPHNSATDYDPSSTNTFLLEHVGIYPDIAYASYSENMNLSWAMRIGSNDIDGNSDMAISELNKLYSVGCYNEALDVDPGPGVHYLLNAASSDGFLAAYKLDCTNRSFYDTIQACSGDSLFLAGEWQTTSGTYYDTLYTIMGCRYVTESVVNFNTTDTSVTQGGSFLLSNDTSANYQWIDCNNSFAIISGETNQTFIPGASGSYAVIVTNGSCVDTSSCYSITSVGINTLSQEEIDFTIYPNPSTGTITIELIEGGTLELSDSNGSLIFTCFFKPGIHTISLNEPPGVYFISKEVNRIKQTLKLIINE